MSYTRLGLCNFIVKTQYTHKTHRIIQFHNVFTRTGNIIQVGQSVHRVYCVTVLSTQCELSSLETLNQHRLGVSHSVTLYVVVSEILQSVQVIGVVRPVFSFLLLAC